MAAELREEQLPESEETDEHKVWRFELIWGDLLTSEALVFSVELYYHTNLIA